MIVLRCLLCFLLATPALAETRGLPDDAPTAAVTRYRAGVQAYRDQRYEDAVREFKVAQSIYPDSPKLAFNLARALERSRQIEPAIAAYEQYLRMAPEASDRAEVEATIAALRTLLDGSRPLLVVTSKPAGASVFLDGATEPNGRTPFEARVVAGAHVVRIRLDGHGEESRSVDAAAGRQAAVDVALRPLAATVGSGPAGPRATQETAPAATWAGWGAVGAGVLATGAGAFFYLSASQGADDIDALAVGDRRGYDQLAGEIEDDNLSAGISFGVGAALLATGVALLLWPAESGASAAVSATPGGLTVRW